ncbi:hypothetical protein [Lysinibacillus sp. NPDC059133]|uniref:hypothetical protein n=1 Tax=Lysinibacillus sp. NPDC059133 TaxID=3346737 RepID=UPI0036AD0FAE
MRESVAVAAGIAADMMNHILEKYKDVHQKVLLTEEAPDVRNFYEKYTLLHGFVSL